MSQALNFAGIVVLLVIVYRLAALYIERKYTAEASRRDEHSEIIDRCRKLEERVRVLERIVTDKRADLEREFDGLSG